MASLSEDFINLQNQQSCMVKDWDWTNPNTIGNPDSDCAKSEAALIESLTKEAYDLAGFEVQYYVFNYDTQRDRLYGEDVNRAIERRFALQVYTPNIPTLTRTYRIEGFDYDELITLNCTVNSFRESSRYSWSDDRSKREPKFDPMMSPRVGDILYFPFIDIFYTIYNVKDFAEKDAIFKSIAITYQIICKVWRNNRNEVMPVDENDQLEEISSYQSLDSMFNIDNQIDKKKDVLYTNKDEVKSIVDPFEGF
jgi:hypothetical protein